MAAATNASGNLRFEGCLDFGPFEVKTYRFRTVSGGFATKMVEVLRPAPMGGKAIVRLVGGEGAFPVDAARLA